MKRLDLSFIGYDDEVCWSEDGLESPQSLVEQLTA